MNQIICVGLYHLQNTFRATARDLLFIQYRNSIFTAISIVKVRQILNRNIYFHFNEIPVGPFNEFSITLGIGEQENVSEHHIFSSFVIYLLKCMQTIYIKKRRSSGLDIMVTCYINMIPKRGHNGIFG